MNRFERTRALGILCLLGFGAAPVSRADQVVLIVENPSEDGLVLAPVDLAPALHWCRAGAVTATGVTARTPDGREVPLQFVPAEDFDGRTRCSGTVVLRLPSSEATRVRLAFEAAGSGESTSATSVAWDGGVETAWYSIRHDAAREGGLPCSISFPGVSKKVEDLHWQDRAHDPEAGSFRVVDDRFATVACVSRGSLCTVVRVRARFVKSDGSAPPSRPEATYDWWYFHDRPTIHVSGLQRQQHPFAWREMHFLELHTGTSFPRWAGGEPLEEGTFLGSRESHSFSRWAAVSDGPRTIALLDSGRTIIYDGQGGYGNYLHARGTQAWTEMAEIERTTSAWLWISGSREPASESPWDEVRIAAASLPVQGSVTVTVDEVHIRIETAESRQRKLPPQERQSAWWHVAAARKLEALGRFDDAIRALEGKSPASWHVLQAGDLGLILERADGGVRLLDLFDSATDSTLLSPATLPLFRVTLREVGKSQDIPLRADAGWGGVEACTMNDGATEIRWSEPRAEGVAEKLGKLRVIVRVTPDAEANELRWRLRVENSGKACTVRSVVFPQLALADPGPGAEVVFPRGCGEVQAALWQRTFRFAGRYPSGWTTMPWMAAYGGRSGLYVGVHDPLGSAREILVESRPTERSVVFSFEEPAADAGRPANSFEPTGEAVWRVLRGDWFDAACVYRDWVRKHARWWPGLSPDGRVDTPLWMRELPVWAMTGGTQESVVPAVREFAEYLGVPVGLHWYNWHRIPFDNDYPHYFPAKDGFRKGVAELQSAGVHVMPYINGRLWDTRDRGAEDFQFNEVARPGVSRNEQGEPWVETYGSKESDGSPVRLAVMCPASQVWQDKVHDIVLRLLDENGTHGVYIDQVAAAQPVLCFDESHGHPLGGGHWWTESYWKLIERIRREMPEGRMLTTECNAEPYVHVFDGYLTWHWQYDGQVPAFPAVYGGAIQMFGRAYRGGPTQDLAFRMKAAQQLVFGEQIGWCSPAEVKNADHAEFLRQVVRLRWELRRYFYAGEMARPPKLEGEIPKVTADWQWSGVWPVTTSAVLLGAWRLPREHRVVLLFANVSDSLLAVRLHLDASDYGLAARELTGTKITARGREDSERLESPSEHELSLEPRSAWAWELSAAD